MTRPYVIGVDPGLTTGICVLDLGDMSAELVQCTPTAVLPILRGITEGDVVAVLAVERFVVGPRAARSSTPRAGQITRELIEELRAWGHPDRCVLRSASQVKPWATDERLAAAGLLAPGKGMPHARDGARHALFSAVADCGAPDPLSSRPFAITR